MSNTAISNAEANEIGELIDKAIALGPFTLDELPSTHRVTDDDVEAMRSVSELSQRCERLKRRLASVQEELQGVRNALEELEVCFEDTIDMFIGDSVVSLPQATVEAKLTSQVAELEPKETELKAELGNSEAELEVKRQQLLDRYGDVINVDISK